MKIWQQSKQCTFFEKLSSILHNITIHVLLVRSPQHGNWMTTCIKGSTNMLMFEKVSSSVYKCLPNLRDIWHAQKIATLFSWHMYFPLGAHKQMTRRQGSKGFRVIWRENACGSWHDMNKNNWATKKPYYFPWNTGWLIGILTMVYEIIPIYLGSIIPYITQPTRIFFIAQLLKCWPKGSGMSCPVTDRISLDCHKSLCFE